jgi:hypothetical protein
MARKPPDPFDVRLTEEARRDLTTFLCTAIDDAKAARSATE